MDIHQAAGNVPLSWGNVPYKKKAYVCTNLGNVPLKNDPPVNNCADSGSPPPALGENEKEKEKGEEKGKKKGEDFPVFRGPGRRPGLSAGPRTGCGPR